MSEDTSDNSSPSTSRLPVLELNGQPLPLTLDVRVWVLERLVLELTKHVTPAAALPPGAVMAIEELKARHPDV